MNNLITHEISDEVIALIHKDVTRTLPYHIYFQKEYSEGQNDLFVILKCLSLKEESLGYVQGLGFMAAILLTYMDRNDSFNVMLKLLNGNKYKIKNLYTNYGVDFYGLKISYYVLHRLFEKYLPKLYKHFMQEELHATMFATSWFLTIFSQEVPIQLTLRVWDIFFIEGKKILYRVALAILKLNEKALLQENIGCVKSLKRAFFDTNLLDRKPQRSGSINAKVIKEFEEKHKVDERIDTIIETAHKFKFPGKLIDDLEREAVTNPRPELVRICDLEPVIQAYKENKGR